MEKKNEQIFGSYLQAVSLKKNEVNYAFYLIEEILLGKITAL